MDETRQLYIISGCNGAGKTTASYTVLPEILLCKEFVNADEIAKGLSPFNPESMAIEAGRLMLKRIDELLAARISFSIETTLATRSYTRLITRAQNAGYKVSLIYFLAEFSGISSQPCITTGQRRRAQCAYRYNLPPLSGRHKQPVPNICVTCRLLVISR